MTKMPEYEVYAIKYGDHKRMRQENFLFKDPHDEASSIDFMIWVIQGGGKTYVVDVGFEQKEAEASASFCSKPTSTTYVFPPPWITQIMKSMLDASSWGSLNRKFSCRIRLWSPYLMA